MVYYPVTLDTLFENILIMKKYRKKAFQEQKTNEYILWSNMIHTGISDFNNRCGK